MADPAAGDDWFELFNAGPLPVELSGLKLTDDLSLLDHSTIPPLSFIGVGPFGYQQFIADDDATGRDNHVGFKLASGGDALGLSTSDGFLIDQVIFGAQRDGVSEGRYPDGAEDIARFPRSSSPGRANTFNSPPLLAVPPDQSVAVGQTLSLKLTAIDADLPNQTLTFSFGAPTPEGLLLNPATGVLTWSPSELQGPSVVGVAVVATDNGTPPLSDRVAFTIRVSGGVLDLRLQAALLAGETLLLQWNAMPGRAYAIESTETLDNVLWRVLGEITAADTVATYPTSPGAGLQQFFRLRLLP
jgi:hypothetical protein